VVVLIADPAETESSCGCGEIIRSVRARHEGEDADTLAAIRQDLDRASAERR
jgi:hypothetical protein